MIIMNNIEEEKCHVIDALCIYFTYQLDRNGEVAISHCAHPKNKSNYEGNCIYALCPKVKEINNE